jgi:hypothetical protein
MAHGRVTPNRGGNAAMNPRMVSLVNRAGAVVAGVPLFAVLAWLLATGSPLAGRLLTGEAGLAAVTGRPPA